MFMYVVPVSSKRASNEESHSFSLSCSRIITATICSSLLLGGCFETLDPPSPCYNLDETTVPTELTIEQQRAGATLTEVQFRTLKDEALHCEGASNTDGQNACQEFYIGKFNLNSSDYEALYNDFPGIDCLEFIPLENNEYGSCDLQRPSPTACSCFFHRDCETNQRCYAGRAYDIDCEDTVGNMCTRCLPRDQPPALR